VRGLRCRQMSRTISSRRVSATRALCCIALAITHAIGAVFATQPDGGWLFGAVVAVSFFAVGLWNLMDASFLDEVEPP
jgi:hypothetical protein